MLDPHGSREAHRTDMNIRGSGKTLIAISSVFPPYLSSALHGTGMRCSHVCSNINVMRMFPSLAALSSCSSGKAPELLNAQLATPPGAGPPGLQLLGANYMTCGAAPVLHRTPSYCRLDRATVGAQCLAQWPRRYRGLAGAYRAKPQDYTCPYKAQNIITNYSCYTDMIFSRSDARRPRGPRLELAKAGTHRAEGKGDWRLFGKAPTRPKDQMK